MGTKQTTGEGKKRLNTGAFIGIVLCVGVLVIGGAVLVGKSDSGAINVTDTIQTSNQMNTDGQNNVETVPESFKNMPNGGLVPKEDQNIPVEAPPVESNDVSTTTNPETDPPEPVMEDAPTI